MWGLSTKVNLGKIGLIDLSGQNAIEELSKGHITALVGTDKKYKPSDERFRKKKKKKHVETPNPRKMELSLKSGDPKSEKKKIRGHFRTFDTQDLGISCIL